MTSPRKPSEAFVAAQLVIYRKKTGRRQHTGPRALHSFIH